MPILLARIDDRLIHGQVAHGWGRALRPTLVVIVSDRLRADRAQGDLYLLGVPEGAEGAVVSVDEALDPAFRSRVEAARTILLFPGPEEPLRLADGGFPLVEVNVGGLHHEPGRRAVLPYVYLNENERTQIIRLLGKGIRVVAQDLPTGTAVPLRELLEGAV